MAATAVAVVLAHDRIQLSIASKSSLDSSSRSQKPLHRPFISLTKRLLPHQKNNYQVPLSARISSSLTTADKPVSHVDKEQKGLFVATQAQEAQNEEEQKRLPIKAFLAWVLLWSSSVLFWLLISSRASALAAAAAADSIRASIFGLKLAKALQGSGWPNEAVVFALATLPVIELRGAIPVGYWMQLHPFRTTLFSILGNMVPVPFILLYLKRFAAFIAGKNASMSNFLDLLFQRAKEKAGPVEEFQWLGLMLFVAVPFPGTGAWTGAIVASILDMPFWSAVSANFFGVVFAGLLVNLLVNLGLKYAVATGFILFIISTVMWSILRFVKKSLSSN